MCQNLTNTYQEKASESYLHVTCWGIRRNCHHEFLGEKFPRSERTIVPKSESWRKLLQPLLIIERSPGFGALVNIKVILGRPRTFLMTWIVSSLPADTSCPCSGNQMVTPCAAASTAQTEATRKDSNLIFREKNVSEVLFKYPCNL